MTHPDHACLTKDITVSGRNIFPRALVPIVSTLIENYMNITARALYSTSTTEQNRIFRLYDRHIIQDTWTHIPCCVVSILVSIIGLLLLLLLLFISPVTEMRL
jgi:hypothetical protein